MNLRPSRRQVLSSLVFAVGSGFGVTAFNYSSGIALAKSLAPDFNPATDIQPLSSTRQNTYPIVLVHGFIGWGRNELNGKFLYWGGLHTDIQQDLINNGFETLTAAVGPISSNWDRACELYAYIKGGTVDYGQAHSSQFGHARFGRAFPGLYPQWGEVNPRTGTVNKVHLIAHSMGGQTVRILEQLLAHGSASEQTATPPGQFSSLFEGNKANWLHSITTISSTHNGGSASNLTPASTVGLTERFLGFVAATLADDQLINYDFKLDQWGLGRQRGETLAHFLARVSSSKFNSTTDASFTDLTIKGASAINGRVMAQPDIYHFSVDTLQTHTTPLLSVLNHRQVPDANMLPFFVPLAFFLGSYTSNKPDPVVIDSKWLPNDGLVNTISMPGPWVNSQDVIIPFNGTPIRGQWSHLGVMDTFGHVDIVGWSKQDMRSWYRELAAFLASLPQ